MCLHGRDDIASLSGGVAQQHTGIPFAEQAVFKGYSNFILKGRSHWEGGGTGPPRHYP